MPIALHQIPGAFQVLALSVVTYAVERVQGSGEVTPIACFLTQVVFNSETFCCQMFFNPAISYICVETHFKKLELY